MWILNHLPESIIHLILVLGLLGTMASFVLGILPFIKKYQLPLQIISTLVLAFGVYLEGGLALKNKYEIEIQKMKTQMAEKAAEAAKINSDIIQKYADQQAQNDKSSNSISRYIEKETIKIDSSCKIAPEVIIAHNAAATRSSVEEATLTLDSQVETASHNTAARGSK